MLGEEFLELAAALGSGPGVPPDPDRVVRFVAKAVPHSEACSVTFLRPSRRPTTVAASSELPTEVDRIQYEEGEGPCLDAATGNAATVVEDLRQDTRWPAFAPRCVSETGVRSMLALRLPIGGDDEAALNLYASQAGAFTTADLSTASMFAPFAALAVQSSIHQQDVTNLEAALSSSRQIGTAIGIIMARDLVSADEAFERLRRSSQDFNRKLRDIAADVELTGALPGETARDEQPVPEGSGEPAPGA
ncbi:GAF and ANTAR domain-containing protein [Phycicoccus ginsengisoli]